MLRKSLTVGAVCAAAVVLAACGGTTPASTPDSVQSSAPAADAPTSSSQPSTAEPSEPSGPVVEVSIDGTEVAPQAERIDAKVGEPVTFIVTSDRAGGLHVHSSPEQTPEFAKGTSTIQVTIDKPGLVEVEEHESGALIVQIEAH